MAYEMQPPVTPDIQTPDAGSWSRKVIICALGACLLAIVAAEIAGMFVGKEVPAEALSLATLITGILAAIVSPSKK